MDLHQDIWIYYLMKYLPGHVLNILAQCDKNCKQIFDEYILLIRDHVSQTLARGRVSRLAHSTKLIGDIEYAIEENLFLEQSLRKYTRFLGLKESLACEDFISMYPTTKFELYDVCCTSESDDSVPDHCEFFINGRFVMADGACINTVFYIAWLKALHWPWGEHEPTLRAGYPKIIWYSLPYFDNFHVTRECFHLWHGKSAIERTTQKQVLTIDQAILSIAGELQKWRVPP